VSKEQQVVAELLTMVQSDAYPVGSALPSERKLAQEFHTSRNTVRNAIRNLEARGLLQVRCGSGCYLLCKEDLYEPLRVAAEDVGGRELEDLFEARYVLEPVIGAYAAMRVDSERLQGLESCVVRLSRAVIGGDTEEIIDGDRQFRDEIALATGNSMFRLAVGQLRPAQKACIDVFASLSEQQRQAAFADYVDVLNGLKAGDAEGTADRLRQNILRLCGYVAQYTGTAMPPLIAAAIRKPLQRPSAVDLRDKAAVKKSSP
jgi:GntR family transcriptional repressor for pyruvate dehydrogenase complex